MHAHSTAKGIASLGRHGDDMIVHMSRDEVKGLQALAQQHGTSLTINPHTGMPEAFKLGRILGAVAPMALGWALGPGGFGMFSSPFTTALAVGAGTGLLTGNLGQGLMAGLGAYGGYGLGDTFAKMGAAVPGGVNQTMAANMTQAATGSPLVGASSQFISPFTPQGIQGGAGLGIGTVGDAGLAANTVGQTENALMTNQVRNAALTGANPAFNAANNINPVNVVNNTVPTSGFSKSAQGVKNLFTWGDDTTKSGWQQFKEAAGTPGKPAGDIAAASKLAGPALGVATAAGALDAPTVTNPYGNRMKRVPTGTYDAQGNMEYKYVPAESYAPTETLNTTNPYANYAYMTVPPQLKLVSGGGEIKSYAVGGTVTTGGLRDLYATTDSPANPQLSRDGYGVGRLENLARQQALTQAQSMGYADGGDVAATDTTPAPGSEASARDAYMSDIQRALMGSSPVHYTGASSAPGFSSSTPYGSDMIGEMIRVSPEVFRYSGYGVGRGTSPEAYAAYTSPSFRKNMAKGGYLDGPGDGMSDSIPATIEGKQPARLADGEFVVPADVVSHLGNGSTKAGSKRLYAMLDKVRQARTGTKQQGKQINADKYLPKTV